MIVGWDDDKEVAGAPGNGAFIVRNSWGSSWGDGGYFYVSYYDESIAFSTLACFDERAESSFTFDTVHYYERMGKANGGASVVSGWSRLFLVPGMGHCGGGPATLDTFDMLGAVVDWVESQKAPDTVRATGRSFPGRSRPLCPYPSHARYKGTGDAEDAASFECR